MVLDETFPFYQRSCLPVLESSKLLIPIVAGDQAAQCAIIISDLQLA